MSWVPAAKWCNRGAFLLIILLLLGMVMDPLRSSTATWLLAVVGAISFVLDLVLIGKWKKGPR